MSVSMKRALSSFTGEFKQPRRYVRDNLITFSKRNLTSRFSATDFLNS